MDMKNLMQKLETINQKKSLVEGKKESKSKLDKEEKNTKTLDTKKKPVKESIRQQLLRAFGLTEATNPHPPGSPQAAAWDNLTPQDQEWIGGGDPTDKTILSRAPNKGMSAVGARQAAAAGAAAQQAASQQQQQQQADAEASAAAASAMNDVDQQYSMGKPTDPNVNPRDTALAKGQVTSPTAPSGQAAQKAAPVKDPKVLDLQQKLISAGAKIKADGIMGPATQAAMKQFPQAVSGSLPLPPGVKPSTAGAGRGGQGGPTAAQLSAGQAGQPSTVSDLSQISSPTHGQEVWVKGTRYEYDYPNKKWNPTFKKGDWGWNTNQQKAAQGFSSPLPGTTQAAQPARAESFDQELSELKRLIGN